MDKKTVWCVFSPQGYQAPKFQHDSEASAKAEAKRLARCHPEQPFYVMQSIGVAIRNEVLFYATGHKNDIEDEIPF